MNMVATDTVVGIVGAVVLVAVMAGVFVYEYNNEDAGASELQEQEHFEEDFLGLDASQDMDGDGVPNYQDDDIDGDGIANASDDSLSTVFAVSGSVGQATPTSQGTPYTQSFAVQNGSEHLQGSVSYQRTSGTVASPSLQATITGPDGFSAQATSTTSGNTVTMTFDVSEEMPAGEYTLTISNVALAGPLSVSPGATSVTGNLELHYATPADGGEHEEH